jgi:beta-lactam-binding protein with PASTA domain
VAGTEVDAGSAVDLVVSTGPPLVPVPNVVGETLGQAQEVLAGVPLTVGRVTEEPSETVPEDSVISSAPEAGAQVAPGSAVDLVVSTGPPPPTVPDVKGLTEGEAEQKLIAARLAKGDVTIDPKSSAEPGTVDRTIPAAGEPLPEGSKVNLILAPPPVTLN